MENDPDAEAVETAGNESPWQESKKSVFGRAGDCFFPEEPEGEKATGVEEEDFEGGKIGETEGSDIPIREV